MKKVFFLMIALMVISVPAFAQVANGGFETGDLTSWETWGASWGGPYVQEVQSATVFNGQYALRLQAGYGSFGVTQAIATIPGHSYQLDLMWKGGANSGGFWNEVLFFNDDGRDILSQMDAPLDSSILTKVDGWGLNPPTTWDWKSPFDGSQWFPNGPQTNVVVATGEVMYVGLKAGASGGTTELFFDNVQVTDLDAVVPEPSSMLALGTGLMGLAGFVVRRRR